MNQKGISWTLRREYRWKDIFNSRFFQPISPLPFLHHKMFTYFNDKTRRVQLDFSSIFFGCFLYFLNWQREFLQSAWNMCNQFFSHNNNLSHVQNASTFAKGFPLHMISDDP
jgi:hypothetical protein